MNIKHICLFLLLPLLVSLNSCKGSTATKTPPVIPAAEPIPDDAATSEEAIRFLEARVKNDPDDMISLNMLAGRYLKRLRETGNVDYLSLATRAAQASLKVLPADHNVGGLGLLAEVEYSSHEFAASRDHAKELLKLDPEKLYPHQLLFDSLLELGDYEKATGLLYKMQRLTDESKNSTVTLEVRLARMESLKGDNKAAQNHLLIAISTALSMKPPPRELTTYCRWQLGENAFAMGDYQAAEKFYNDALTTFPDYFRARASLGRVKAAQGDLNAAIQQYERAIKQLPDPTFVAALGDLYTLAGRNDDGKAQYALVEQIGKLSELNGVLYNRNLALFYADHDLKADEAYANAQKEYEARKDIYGADAVAWTALKAKKIPEAQTAIKEALKLNTKDARLFYHAGMIAHAAGDQTSARYYLQQALTLNPQFDPLQARTAKKTLDELGG